MDDRTEKLPECLTGYTPKPLSPLPDGYHYDEDGFRVPDGYHYEGGDLVKDD